ncbi:MAG: hypothetical protein AAGF11_27715 [Myxococcota bacterium]
MSYHVRITFEGPAAQAERVDAARDALVKALPPDTIVTDPSPA